MKRFIIYAATLLMALSCQEKDFIGIQKSTFPGETGEEGKVEVETIFNQSKLNLTMSVHPELSATKFSSACKKLMSLKTENTGYTATMYNGTIPGSNNSLIPEGNIAIIFTPDFKSLSTINDVRWKNYDLSVYNGCALLALTDMGSLYVIDSFMEKDILGSLNGLVAWMNEYVATQQKLSNGNSGGSLPDAETLFSSFNSGYTFTFDMPNQEVAAVACSDKDYINGNGTVDVLFKVTPLHAFDDQNGHGDYYVVTSSAAFNSQSMYKGQFKKMHGGVHVRICGSFAREFTVQSFISDMKDNPVGQYVAGAAPAPTTTTGATSYTSGITWNIGASLTGGIAGGEPTATATVNGGVSVSNSKTRNISDLDILLDQKTNVANYTLKFNNLPKYDAGAIWFTHTPDIATHTATLDHSYIIYLPDVKDNSKETHKINVKITKLNYGACRFYTTGADLDNFTWGLDKMKTTTTYMTGGMQIPLPNRFPTGKIKITQDTEKFGKYIYSIKATITDGSEQIFRFSGSSYGLGNSFESNLPTGSYNIEMKVGDSASSTVIVKSANPVKIVRGEQTQINTGADFIE